MIPATAGDSGAHTCARATRLTPSHYDQGRLKQTCEEASHTLTWQQRQAELQVCEGQGTSVHTHTAIKVGGGVNCVAVKTLTHTENRPLQAQLCYVGVRTAHVNTCSAPPTLKKHTQLDSPLLSHISPESSPTASWPAIASSLS